jgi:hypothetical protein
VLADSLTSGGAAAVSAHVRALDKDFGIRVDLGANHKLALNHFDGAKPTDHANQPKYDYEKMIATVAARTDERLRVEVSIGGADRDRVLIINVPDAETWYCTPGTVLDVTNGNLERSNDTTEEMVLRDDSPRLRQIAAQAVGWYGRPRANMRLTLSDCLLGFHPGLFIPAVRDKYRAEPVNSPVTAVSWDFGEELSTTVQTNYAELDFTHGSGPARHALK